MNPRQWNWSLHLTEKWDMINYGLLAVAWTQRRRHVMPFQINFPAALFHQLPLKLFWKGSLVDQISSVLSPGKALPICVLCQNCNDKLKKTDRDFCPWSTRRWCWHFHGLERGCSSNRRWPTRCVIPPLFCANKEDLHQILVLSGMGVFSKL